MIDNTSNIKLKSKDYKFNSKQPTITWAIDIESCSTKLLSRGFVMTTVVEENSGEEEYTSVG